MVRAFSLLVTFVFWKHRQTQNYYFFFFFLFFLVSSFCLRSVSHRQQNGRLLAILQFRIPNTWMFNVYYYLYNVMYDFRSSNFNKCTLFKLRTNKVQHRTELSTEHRFYITFCVTSNSIESSNIQNFSILPSMCHVIVITGRWLFFFSKHFHYLRVALSANKVVRTENRTVNERRKSNITVVIAVYCVQCAHVDYEGIRGWKREKRLLWRY